MLAVQRGEVGSRRGAEILDFDPQKSFDPTRSNAGGRVYETRGARTKDFQYSQRVSPKGFRTESYTGVKSPWFADSKFATTGANTKGKYEIPNAAKKADTKAMPVSDARESRKTMATRNLPDGGRSYLGKEMDRIGRAPTPESLADWRQNGETTVTVGGRVEKFSTLKPLSLEDVRDLLNKNK